MAHLHHLSHLAKNYELFKIKFSLKIKKVFAPEFWNKDPNDFIMPSHLSCLFYKKKRSLEKRKSLK